MNGVGMQPAPAEPDGLDPEVVRFRDRQAGLGLPGYLSVGPVRAREVSRAITAWRHASAEPVDRVRSVEDVRIPTSSRVLDARVYRPDGDVVGEILYFHGGGFVVGDLDTCEAHCRALAARVGAVVTSVDYSLSPESPYPVAVHEAQEVARWMCRDAILGATDRLPLAVAGDSAGANLAAAVAAFARDDAVATVDAQLLIYPMLDPSMSCPSIVRNGEGYMMDRTAIEWFWELYLPGMTPDEAMATSPSSGRMDGLAPAVVVTAGYDPFEDEGLEHARRLSAAGVPTTVLSYPSLVHGFFGWGAHVSTAQRAISQICSALRDTLRAARG